MRLTLTNHKLHLEPKRVVWADWCKYRPFAVWIDGSFLRVQHTMDAYLKVPVLRSINIQLKIGPRWRLLVSKEKPYRVIGASHGALRKVFLCGWWVSFWYRDWWWQMRIKKLRGL